MTPSTQRKLNQNVIYLGNGYSMKVKHILGAVLAAPFLWTFVYTIYSLTL